MHNLDEQEDASEDADKDIGGLPNSLRAASFNVMSDELRTIGLRSKEAADQGQIDKQNSGTSYTPSFLKQIFFVHSCQKKGLVTNN